jgi:hypothetical protein
VRNTEHYILPLGGMWIIIGSAFAERHVWRYAYKDKATAQSVSRKQQHRWSREYDEQRTLADIVANYIGETKAIGFAGVKNDPSTAHIVRAMRADEANGYFDWAALVARAEDSLPA